MIITDMGEVLQVVGGFAGIGGIALGVFLLVYRDFVRDLIRERAFRKLTSEHATILLAAAIFLTFSIAILGLFAGLATGPGAGRFIVLVGMVLVFILAVILIVIRHQTPVPKRDDPPRSGEKEIFGRVRNLIDSNRLDDADRELSRSASTHQRNADYFYWKSEVAFARDNLGPAETYIEKSLDRNPRHVNGIVLKLKILLLSDLSDARAKAREFAENSRGISDSLDSWIARLTEKGMFDPGVRSNSELDTKCPFPTPAPFDDSRTESGGGRHGTSRE